MFIDLIFGTGDYVPTFTNPTQFSLDPISSSAATPAGGDIYDHGNLKSFLFLCFLALRRAWSPNPRTDFRAQWLKRRGLTQGSALK